MNRRGFFARLFGLVAGAAVAPQVANPTCVFGGGLYVSEAEGAKFSLAWRRGDYREYDCITGEVREFKGGRVVKSWFLQGK